MGHFLLIFSQSFFPGDANIACNIYSFKKVIWPPPYHYFCDKNKNTKDVIVSTRQ